MRFRTAILGIAFSAACYPTVALAMDWPPYQTTAAVIGLQYSMTCIEQSDGNNEFLWRFHNNRQTPITLEYQAVKDGMPFGAPMGSLASNVGTDTLQPGQTLGGEGAGYFAYLRVSCATHSATLYMKEKD